MRRPDKAAIKKAIEDAGGNLSRAAGRLGCSRASLYQWVYQFDLTRFAGIDTEGFMAATTKAPTTTATDLLYSATVRLPESLWKRTRIRAIEEDVTVSDFVRKALEASLGK